MWPVDEVSGAPSYTGRVLRQLTGLQWARNPGRPLGAASGIVVGTPTNLATCPTGTTYQVLPFGGVIDGETSAVAGPYAFSFDSNQTGSLNASHATLDRIDLLYVKVSDPAEGDGSTNPIIELKYLAGTAAATPTQPATPARSIPAWAILVPHAGGTPVVSFVGAWAVAAGGIYPANSSIGYPASPYPNQLVYDDALDQLLRYNGATWGLPNQTGWQAVAVAGSFGIFAGLSAAVWRDGNTVTVRGLVAPTGGYTTSHTYTAAVTLPAGFRPGDKVFRNAATNGIDRLARVELDTDGTVTIITNATTAPSFVDLSCLSGFIAEN